MRLFGLIGYPLSHSFSQHYFTNKFKREQLNDCTYTNFEIATIDALHTIIANNPNLVGLNVTIPYKELVLPLLDELSPEAKEIGAVNTIKIENAEGKKKLIGYNTDVYGFEQSIKQLLSTPLKALVLGNGGAAKAVCYVLAKHNVPFVLVSRQLKCIDEKHIVFENIDEELMRNCNFIINTTPLGMYPNNETYPPVPYPLITPQHFIYDLVYNPEETVFLARAKQQGATVKNGLEMLHLQAEKAWGIWNA